jgi:DtxR family transcriptional regulator, Mn-dependent transcriptional regulator
MATGSVFRGRMRLVSDLIDTTEMYLRTIYELEEEGIVPLRARIAERLHQSGPTVSQTVARMERDGLLAVEGDRHLELSDDGRALAIRVMRKHRLAECLLMEVIGLDLEQVHDEACRWEHVMSEQVERRLVEILERPTQSPYGNPIPGLSELGVAIDSSSEVHGLQPLTDALDRRSGEPRKVVLRRIAEELQKDVAAMSLLRRIGAKPGHELLASADGRTVLVSIHGESVELDEESAAHIFVSGS